MCAQPVTQPVLNAQTALLVLHAQLEPSYRELPVKALVTLDTMDFREFAPSAFQDVQCAIIH